MTAQVVAKTRTRGRWSELLVLAVTLSTAWMLSLTALAPVAVAQGVQSQQWYLDAMQAEDIWEVSTGKGVTVAVIDSGVDASTPTLQGRVLPGANFAARAGDETSDYLGHGTTMAELIAGTGKGGGLRGLAPDAEIVPIRIAMPEDFGGGQDATPAVLAKAIKKAADRADIINMSFGTYPSPDEREAVEYAARKGRMMFASVGNDAEKEGAVSMYPAQYPNVAAVAAGDESGTVSDYSKYGKDTDVTFMAPGDNIPTHCTPDITQYCDGDGGSSAASALASASAALIWAEHPDWNANQVMRVMIETAGLKKKSRYVGWGSVKPGSNLLSGKGDPGDPNVNPLTGERTKDPAAASPSPEDSTDKSTPGDQQAADDDGANTAAEGDSDGDDDLIPIIALAAGVALLLAMVFAFVRQRRQSP